VIDLDNLLACLQLNQKELAELVGVSPQFRIMIRPKQKQMRWMWERFLKGGYKKRRRWIAVQRLDLISIVF
jgi:hypothetical protein